MEESDKPDNDYEKDKPPESSWFSPSSWFSSKDKKSTEYKWEPGKYQSDFFNKFDPKKVFDKRTKESKELRKKFIIEMFDEVFRIDDKAQYFKDLSLEKSVRDDINLVYKGRPIATYSIKHDTITQKRGKPLSDFKEAVKIYHLFTTTQELKPQIENILNPPPEEEFELDPLLKEIEERRKQFEEEREAEFKKDRDRIINPILHPEKEETSFSDDEKKEEISVAKEFVGGLWDLTKGAVSITSTIVGGTAKGVAKGIEYVSNTNGKPEDTAVNISQVRTDIETNIDYIDLKTELEAAKTLLNEKKLQTDSFKKQIEEKNREIKSLQSQLDSVSKLSTDEALKLKTKIQKLKQKRDELEKSRDEWRKNTTALTDKIEELHGELKFTGKQLIEKDEEIDSQKEKLKKLQDYIDTFKDSSSHVSNELSEAKNNLKKLQTEYDQLLSDYKGKEKEIEDTKKDIPNIVSKALDSLKKVTEKDRKTIKDLKDFQKSLELKNKTLQEGMNALDANYQSEQTKFKDLKIQTDKLDKDYKDVKSKYKKLQTDTNSFAKNMQADLDKYRSERDNFEKANKDLSTSLQTYKESLDILKKKQKLDLEEKEKKLQEANTQIQDLQDKFEKNEISLDSYKKKFKESQNKFSLAKKRYEETTSSDKEKLNKLLREKDELQLNNEKLEKDISYSKSRITAKEEEIQGYLEEIENKRQEIEKISSGLSQKDFYAEQYNIEKTKFDKLTLDHNSLVHKAQQTQLDKYELESELERLQKEMDSTKKEMENLKKKMIDPKDLEEARQHVKELSNQLTEKEKELKEKVKDYKKLVDEVKDTRNKINKQKEEYETKLEKQKNEYEKQLETLRKRKKEFMTTKELKDLSDDLDKIDAESYEDLNYDETIKRWREKRDEYDGKSKDKKNTLLKKLQYERSKKFMDEKIDLLNYKFKKPLETEEGKKVVRRLKRSQMWFFQKIWDDIKSNKATSASLLASFAGLVFNIVYFSLQKTAQGVVYITKEVVVPQVIKVANKLTGQAVIEAALIIPKTLLWAADHLIEFMFGVISISIFLYQEYGEEASFPILAFWCYILAMGMIAIHYVQSTYESAKKYIPFTN